MISPKSEHKLPLFVVPGLVQDNLEWARSSKEDAEAQIVLAIYKGFPVEFCEALNSDVLKYHIK